MQHKYWQQVQPLSPIYDGQIESLFSSLAFRTDVPIGTSKLGGLPDLPDDVDWPKHNGVALTFLAQINLAEYPLAAFGMTDGILSFFYSMSKELYPCTPHKVLLLKVNNCALRRRSLPKHWCLSETVLKVAHISNCTISSGEDKGKVCPYSDAIVECDQEGGRFFQHLKTFKTLQLSHNSNVLIGFDCQKDIEVFIGIDATCYYFNVGVIGSKPVRLKEKLAFSIH